MTDVRDPFRPVVVAPTHNNGRTLTAILQQLDALALPIIVINDGATDDTADILRRTCGNDRCVAITHATNRGKAAALRTGFEAARARQFTHALTIDTDGQHDVADAVTLLHLAKAQPDALVIGARPIVRGSYPALSRCGRSLSNALIRLESGARVNDSQCGLRVYPLEWIAQIPASSARYGFETEIITRCAWAGVRIVETPIRCIYDVPGGRVSHFRPVVDSLRAVRMHAWLLLRSVHAWPVPKLAPTKVATGTIAERTMRWMNPLAMWRDIRAGRGDGRFPASVSVGMFIAVLPIYGIKTVVCLLIAKRFRLQPLVVLAVSSLNTPPTGPLLAAMSIVTGYLILHHTTPALWQFNPVRDGWANTFGAVAGAWVIGSLIVGTILAAITYALARSSVKWAVGRQL